jgi:hypothetical protein
MLETIIKGVYNMYYQASICLMTENFVDNDSSKGCDGSMQDCGEIEVIKKPTIKELKIELNRRYDLSKFDIFENRLEAGFEEHDYNEDIHYLAQYSIYLCKVEVTELSADILK